MRPSKRGEQYLERNMMTIARDFPAVISPDRGAMDWGLAELVHLSPSGQAPIAACPRMLAALEQS